MEEARLRDLLTLQRGYDITKKEQNEGVVPVISSGGISSFHSESKVQGPGVVIGRKGTLGKVFFSTEDFWPHDTTLWVKDFKGNEPKFIYYLLQVLDFARFDSGAANPTLNRNHVHSLKIAVPNQKVRTKIASILSAYDDLIDNNNQRIQLLEEMAEEIYKEWFVRLRFPGYETATFRDKNGNIVPHGTEGALPEGWGYSKISEKVNIISGGTPKTSRPEYWNGHIPFFSPKDYRGLTFCFKTESSITDFGLKNCNSLLLQENTIIITARGTVGNLVLVGQPMAMNQSCFALTGKAKISSYFIFLLLKEQVEYLKKVANGATFSAITIETFEKLKVLMPSPYLIQIFSKNITPLFNQIKVLQKKNETLQQTRDLLLPRLISGKLDVENLDIPIAI